LAGEGTPTLRFLRAAPRSADFALGHRAVRAVCVRPAAERAKFSDRAQPVGFLPAAVRAAQKRRRWAPLSAESRKAGRRSDKGEEISTGEMGSFQPELTVRRVAAVPVANDAASAPVGAVRAPTFWPATCAGATSAVRTLSAALGVRRALVAPRPAAHAGPLDSPPC
jgi:hypothetical protein